MTAFSVKKLVNDILSLLLRGRECSELLGGQAAPPVRGVRQVRVGQVGVSSLGVKRVAYILYSTLITWRRSDLVCSTVVASHRRSSAILE